MVFSGLRDWSVNVDSTERSRECGTLLKSSLVARISFHVLFSSWMQMQKNSSKERSWVKNMGWKSWQFSLAVGEGGKESQGSNSGVHYDRLFIRENHEPMVTHERAS